MMESDEPKEVFAFYGLAMYQAQVLETALLNLLVALQACGRAGVTRTDIDAWFASHETKTFGTLVASVRRLTPISDEVEELVREALGGRNHLAHHFFREHAEDFISVSGARRMIEALRIQISLFQKAQQAFEAICEPILGKLGVSQTLIDMLMNEAYQRARASDATPLWVSSKALDRDPG